MLLLTPAILGGSLTLLLYTVSQHSVRVVTTTYLRRLAPSVSRGQGASVHRTAEKSYSRKLGWYAFGMKIELLYFDGCPTYGPAHQALKQALSEEGIDARVQLIAVNTNEEAQRMRFPGSPTIRVNGRDLFPTTERQSIALGCRMYPTPEGLRGTPTVGMLREELRRQHATI